MQMLGVDIGGSGIKGCLVDTETGELIGERHRLVTPQPATPAAVAHTLKALVEHFQWKGPVGCGFPATIHNGIAKNASNIDKSWIETDAAHLFADVTGLPCHVLNDADAAGLAEMRFGTGRDRKGVIILITVGTGIGTAVFVNGQLLPNTELGHLILEGMVAEHYCSDAVRGSSMPRDWRDAVAWSLRVRSACTARNPRMAMPLRSWWPLAWMLLAIGEAKLEKRLPEYPCKIVWP